MISQTAILLSLFETTRPTAPPPAIFEPWKKAPTYKGSAPKLGGEFSASHETPRVGGASLKGKSHPWTLSDIKAIARTDHPEHKDVWAKHAAKVDRMSAGQAARQSPETTMGRRGGDDTPPSNILVPTSQGLETAKGLGREHLVKVANEFIHGGHVKRTKSHELDDKFNSFVRARVGSRLKDERRTSAQHASHLERAKRGIGPGAGAVVSRERSRRKGEEEPANIRRISPQDFARIPIRSGATVASGTKAPMPQEIASRKEGQRAASSEFDRAHKDLKGTRHYELAGHYRAAINTSGVTGASEKQPASRAKVRGEKPLTAASNAITKEIARRAGLDHGNKAHEVQISRAVAALHDRLWINRRGAPPSKSQRPKGKPEIPGDIPSMRALGKVGAYESAAISRTLRALLEWF